MTNTHTTKEIRKMKRLPLNEETNIFFVAAVIMLFVVLYNELAPARMPFENIFLLIIFACIGSLLPKIDNDMSVINRLRAKYFPFVNKIGNPNTQRDVTHSLTTVAKFVVIIAVLQIFTKFSIFTEIMLDITIGYVIYLVQTTFSKTGVLWLHPFKEWDIDPVTHVASQKRIIPDRFLYKEGGETEKKIGQVSKVAFILLTIYCFLQIAIFPLFNYSPFNF